ncbi:hypothetical protein C8Q76DRAFT_708306 [Earliella scabrosa]|nr:hypothetical protein C8Q76DRAFT_708306 [Earliella scabrosa]
MSTSVLLPVLYTTSSAFGACTTWTMNFWSIPVLFFLHPHGRAGLVVRGKGDIYKSGVPTDSDTSHASHRTNRRNHSPVKSATKEVHACVVQTPSSALSAQ